jgi:hypothetical protein
MIKLFQDKDYNIPTLLAQVTIHFYYKSKDTLSTTYSPLLLVNQSKLLTELIYKHTSDHIQDDIDIILDKIDDKII